MSRILAPVAGFLQRTDDLLRRPRGAEPEASLGQRAAILVLFGMVYGAAMGTFGGVWDVRALQVLFSAVKVPLLLGATFLVGLPAFFVIGTLLGLRRDLAEAIGALVATQAGVAVVLASLAPLTLFWYASCADYPTAVLFNGVMFAVASLAGQQLLRRYYGRLLARNAKHRWMLWAWITIYVFVGIQMGWVLRPFVGSPGAAVRFLRAEPWQNAYVVVARLIADRLGW